MSETFHAEKGPFLRELQPGDRFIGYYVLRNKQLEPFRDATRGYFLTLILSDRSGQLLARVWEGAEDIDAELVKGEVVKINGEVETYLERTQIRVLRVRPGSPGNTTCAICFQAANTTRKKCSKPSKPFWII